MVNSELEQVAKGFGQTLAARCTSSVFQPNRWRMKQLGHDAFRQSIERFELPLIEVAKTSTQTIKLRDAH
jgi:hypothetical protein